MKLRLLLIAFSISLLLPSYMFSQMSDLDNPLTPTSRGTVIYVGVLGGYNGVLPTAELRTFANDNFCPKFSNGSGHGYFFGAFYEQTIGKKVNSQHSIQGRIIYNQVPSSFTQAGDIRRSLLKNTVTNEYQVRTSTTEHTLDVSYSLLTVELLYRFNVYNNIGLCIGPSFDFPMTKTYKQDYSIISPNDVQFVREEEGLNYTYENNDRTVVVKDGTIENASGFRFGIKLGLQYEIITGGAVDFIPGIFYNFGITNVTSQDTWRVNMLQAGVDVRWGLKI